MSWNRFNPKAASAFEEVMDQVSDGLLLPPAIRVSYYKIQAQKLLRLSN